MSLKSRTAAFKQRIFLVVKSVGSVSTRVEQARVQTELDSLQRTLEAKEAQMQRMVNGTGQVSALKQHYDRVLSSLETERDSLQKERTALIQVPQP